MPTSQTDLGRAVYMTLEAGARGRPGDLSVLRSPRVFYSLLADLIGADSPESMVFDRACENERFLSFFFAAAQRGTVEALSSAVIEGREYLAMRTATDPAAAHRIAEAMAEGVAQYVGIVGYMPKGYAYEPYDPTPNINDEHIPTQVWQGSWDSRGHTNAIPSSSVGEMPYYGQAPYGQPPSSSFGVPEEDRMPSDYDAPVGRGPTPIYDMTPKGSVVTNVPGGSVVDPAITGPGQVPVNLAGGGSSSYRRVVILVAVAAALFVAAGFIALRAIGEHGNLADDSHAEPTEVEAEHDVASGMTTETANQTTATLSFKANGAKESDAPKQIECDNMTDVKLPEPGDLHRTGYAFAGWGESKDATVVYAPGDSYYVSGDTTLYAIWNILVEVSDKFESTEIAYAADDGGYVAMVFVTSHFDTTVDLRADFEFLDDKGEVVESDSDSAWSIGPGDTTMLTRQSVDSSVKASRWSMVAMTPAFGEASVTRDLESSIVKADDEGLEVEVKNTGDKPAWLMFCTVYGHDEEQRFAQQTNMVDEDKQKISPGKSTKLKYEGAYWQYFQNDVYLYGYADPIDE